MSCEKPTSYSLPSNVGLLTSLLKNFQAYIERDIHGTRTMTQASNEARDVSRDEPLRIKWLGSMFQVIFPKHINYYDNNNSNFITRADFIKIESEVLTLYEVL